MIDFINNLTWTDKIAKVNLWFLHMNTREYAELKNMDIIIIFVIIKKSTNAYTVLQF